MDYSTRSKAFRIGLGGGLILFALLNVLVYIVSGRPHGGQTIGFPMPVYVEQFTSPMDALNPEASHFEWYFLEHIPIDLFLIFSSSLGIGLLTELVANTFMRRRNNKDLK